MKDVDGRIRRGRADAPGFREVGDKKRSAAGFGQSVRDGIDAAAVGVAWENCRAFGISALCKPFPVKPYRGQIDFQDGASFALRRALQNKMRRQSSMADDEAASPIGDLSIYRAVDEDVR